MLGRQAVEQDGAQFVSIAAFSMSDDNKLFLDMCVGAIFGCSMERPTT